MMHLVSAPGLCPPCQRASRHADSAAPPPPRLPSTLCSRRTQASRAQAQPPSLALGSTRARRVACFAVASTPPSDVPAPAPPSSPEERKRRLLAVVKPPIYSVAFVPVLVGFAVAVHETGVPHPGLLLAFLASASLVIAWLNLSNDAWDSETSVDVGKAESAVRFFGGDVGRVHALAAACLLAGVGGLAALCLSLGAPSSWRVALLLASALCCGVLYQAPPFRWSYKGLGEPLCFLAFGPLATTAFYLAARAASCTPTAAGAAAAAAPPCAAAALCALLVGATTTSILFCSHFHQLDTDAAAGKRSPIVRLGTERAAGTLAWAVYATYGGLVLATLLRVIPLLVAVASLATAPVAGRMMRFVAESHGDPSVVFRAKFYAVRWHAAHGLALTLAFVAARMFF